MSTIIKTEAFDTWLRRLKDPQAVSRIASPIVRAGDGNLGDVKPVGEGVSEMRIDHGPGIRVYFVQRGSVLLLLLCGGDKRTQAKDIERAKRLAREWLARDWED